MKNTQTENITELLNKWSEGDMSQESELMNLLYPTIHKIAQIQLSKNHKRNFDTTEVVSEAFIKLEKQKIICWKNKEHFLAIVAKIIRRLLIDEFRAQTCKKRGGEYRQVTLESVSSLVVGKEDVDLDLLELDELLSQLEQLDGEAAKVVELKFFAGLTQEETAQVCNMSVSSVNSTWKFAKSWLLSQFSN